MRQGSQGHLTTLADKSARLGNYIVDIIFIILIGYVIIYPFATFYPEILDDDSFIIEIVFSAVFLLYYFIFEWKLGKTPGKFLTKTNVVGKNGSKPTLKNLVIRTLLRMIAVEAFAFLFSAYILHDMLSKTHVVKQADIRKE
jgi:uncharacterized RDD family membrane protein YckC